MQPKIIILSGRGKFAPFVYNGLKDSYPVEKVIIEEDEDYKTVLKRRKKRIGFIKVTGQYLFNKYIIKKLMKVSKGRIKEIIRQYHLNGEKIPDDKKIHIKSVNDKSTIDLIQEINPNIILVNGTRIINKKLLQSVKAHFINLHSGINPSYRGNGGAYWALVNNEPDKCGSTIHFIDEGIDTGAILYQDTVQVSDKDNYLTYHFLQIAKEIELVKKAIHDVVNNNIKEMPGNGASKLWYEPTIWEYWYNHAVKKVK